MRTYESGRFGLAYESINQHFVLVFGCIVRNWLSKQNEPLSLPECGSHFDAVAPLSVTVGCRQHLAECGCFIFALLVCSFAVVVTVPCV